MSKLSYMYKLLDGVEVEWRSLGEIYNFQYGKGNTIPKTGGEFPVYGSNGIVGSHHEYNSEDAPVIGHIGAYAGIVNWGKGKHFVTYNGVICRMKSEEVLPQYAYYILLLQNFGEKSNSASQPFVSYHILETPVVPIPPLNVQAEIVRILDAFTTLTAELTAELVARKQQYAYYQEELLTFEDNMEWEELKEIAVFSQGIQVDTSKQFSEKPDSFVRFLRIVDFVKDNEPPRYIKNPGDKYVKNEGDLVMIRYGARAAGKVFLKYSGAIANNMFQIKLTTCKITIAYLHCYLSQQKIYNFLNSNGGNSTMPAITFSQIGAIKIPIPTLSEQERIVTICNKFDALTTSLTEGLPREIALRQQQYEYYRELLLSFPKLEGEA